MAKESFRAPTYDLETVKGLIRTGARTMTALAFKRAGNEGFTTEGAYEITLRLTSSEFYKTMEAEKLPGFFQDVYRYKDGSCDLYIKLQIIEETGIQKARVIDFKSWGAA
jgi:hypothetical protein